MSIKRGKRYGRLVAVKEEEKGPYGHIMWLFQCDCGNTKIIAKCNVLKGVTKSCGCLQKEIAVKNGTTHGMYGTRIYNIWGCMRGRCKNKNFKDYGDRGIKVCKDWHKFINFYRNMGVSYEQHVQKYGESNTQIDRVDVNGNYNLNNCRWVTSVEQQSNKRNSRYLTFKGKTQTMAWWSRETGISSGCLFNRIFRDGWELKKALTTPSISKKCGLWL